MTFKSWWLYLLFILLILMVIGLGAGGYFLYQQRDSMQKLASGNQALRLRLNRLEASVFEGVPKPPLPANEMLPEAQDETAGPRMPGGAKPEPKRASAPEPPHAQAVDISQVRPEMLQHATASQNEAEPGSAAKPRDASEANESTAQAESAEKAGEPSQTLQLQDEPRTSDRVSISMLTYSRKGKQLEVRFRVVNTRKPNDPAIGYAVVVLRGTRAKRPWVEAWPPMQVTPLGRPENYKRGTPFSVQRYRKVRAKFSMDDKKLDLMEIVIYSNNGKVMLVHPVELKL